MEATQVRQVRSAHWERRPELAARGRWEGPCGQVD